MTEDPLQPYRQPMVTATGLILGLDGKDTVLLLLTLTVGVVNFSSQRSNFIQGLVHLILFLAYVILIFD